MREKSEVNKSQAIRDYYKSNPKATGTEVVEGLGKQGITVSVNLVNTVKSAHNKRQADKRAAKAEGKSGDKQPEVKKTKAVKEYLNAHKRAKAQEVVDALAEQGITITVGYVRTIKAKSKRRRRAVNAVVAAAPTGIGVPEIKAALKFVKEIGGIAAAKQALAAAVEIKKIV